MRLRWLLPLPLALLACSAASPPATLPAPATTEPAPAASPAAPAGPAAWESVDPRAVRCGVDDRPRNVLGQGSGGRRPGRDLASASPQGDPGEAAPRAKLKLALALPPPAAPRVKIERQAPQVVSPAGTKLGSEFDIDAPLYDECSPQMTATRPPRPTTLTLELGPDGAPLRVTPSEEPTPYLHCLMEQACQLKARADLGQPVKVQLPLKFTFDFQPGDILPDGSVSAIVEGVSGSGDELQQELRANAIDQTRYCGYVPEQARLSLTLDFTSALNNPGYPQSGRRGLVTKVVVRSQEGTIPEYVLKCVRESLPTRGYSWVASAGRRTERVTIVWNP